MEKREDGQVLGGSGKTISEGCGQVKIRKSNPQPERERGYSAGSIGVRHKRSTGRGRQFLLSVIVGGRILKHFPEIHYLVSRPTAGLTRQKQSRYGEGREMRAEGKKTVVTTPNRPPRRKERFSPTQ